VLHALLQSKTAQLIENLEAASIKFLTVVTTRQSTRTQGHLELARVANA